MRKKFILLILLQVVLLAGMIVYRHYWVVTGKKVLLRTEPVDPRDIFRGDYVQLRYEISTLNLGEMGIEEQFRPMERVYVHLEKSPDGTFRATSVSREPPKGKTYIQGRAKFTTALTKWEVTFIDDSGQTHLLRPSWFGNAKKGDRVTFCLDEQGRVIQSFKEGDSYKPTCRGPSLQGIIEEIKTSRSMVLEVEYGIESFFVEEGKGKKIESSRDARKVVMEIALRKDGRGTITALLMEGKRFE